MPSLLRAALLGLATGGRATAGLTALSLTAPPSTRLGNRWTRRLAGTATGGEWLGDKLPQTPSRLQPEGFLPRLACGAVGGAIVSSRAGDGRGRTALAAAAGLLGAVAGSRLGAAWRQQASRRFGNDLPGALIEDAWVLGAARFASRPRG